MHVAYLLTTFLYQHSKTQHERHIHKQTVLVEKRLLPLL